MATTYTLISSVTVGSGGAANIEFTSIPATYTDLCLLLSGRIDANYGQTWYEIYLRVNGSTGTGRDLYGNGSAAASSTTGEIRIYGIPSNTSTASTFSNASIYIPNYASSTQNKSISVDSVSENNATAAIAQLGAEIYASNTAITSLKLDPYNAANFVQHSTAYLYGISNA
jgi:hypothetical protein